MLTNYLVSEPRSNYLFFTRTLPKDAAFDRVKVDSRRGVLLAPRNRPLQEVNCTHSTLVEPLLAT